MSIPYSKTVKVTKIGEVDNPLHPNNYPIGYERIGTLLEEPRVGERFNVIGPGMRLWSTSGITKILPDNVFETYSSIYKWEIVEDPLQPAV